MLIIVVLDVNTVFPLLLVFLPLKWPIYLEILQQNFDLFLRRMRDAKRLWNKSMQLNIKPYLRH
jgi:hypothetical protein